MELRVGGSITQVQAERDITQGKLADYLRACARGFEAVPGASVVSPVVSIAAAAPQNSRLTVTDAERADLASFVRHLQDLAEVARTVGLMGLKVAAETEDEPFLRKGMEVLTTLTDDGERLRYTIEEVTREMSERALVAACPGPELVRRSLSLLFVNLVWHGRVDVLAEVASAFSGPGP